MFRHKKDPDLTLGEKRVRTTFNPSYSGIVDNIKQLAAQFINEVEKLKGAETDAEAIRLISLAQTHAEIAVMFGVKAATA